MTKAQIIVTILMAVLSTVLTRALPFAVFSEKRPLPPFIEYLGKVLAGAVFGLLVVYCFKGVSVFSFPYGIPELIAALIVVGVHLWRRSMLISVISGTAVYMIILQAVLPVFQRM